MKRVVLILFLATEVMSAESNLADAAIVTVTYSGRVSSITAKNDDDSDGSDAFRNILPFVIGDSYTATFVYDTEAVDSNPNPSYGTYEALKHELDINGTVIGSATPQLTIYNNSSLGNDEFIPRSGGFDLYLPAGWAMDATAGGWAFNPYFVDSTGTLWDTDALPTSVQTSDFDRLLDFNLTVLRLSHTWTTPLGRYTGKHTNIRMDVDTVSSTLEQHDAIPEPSSLASMMGLGLFGLILRRRRRA